MSPFAHVHHVYRYADRRGEVRLETFPVLVATRCGVWVDIAGEHKFINLTVTKQFACESLAKAKTSFLARKYKQLSILNRQMADANTAIAAVQAGNVQPDVVFR